MSLFGVSVAKEKELLKRLRLAGILEEDLEERFIRASGPGGQKVNKSSSCVFLRHIPTGIAVKCQKERLQSLNRFIARRRLLDLIEKKRTGIIAEKRKRIEKIRRQKRRRTRRAKEKILANKRLHSEKKHQRAKIKPHLAES